MTISPQLTALIKSVTVGIALVVGLTESPSVAPTVVSAVASESSSSYVYIVIAVVAGGAVCICIAVLLFSRRWLHPQLVGEPPFAVAEVMTPYDPPIATAAFSGEDDVTITKGPDQYEVAYRAV
jgi:hypothetical protein